jgi:hypothetical protein
MRDVPIGLDISLETLQRGNLKSLIPCLAVQAPDMRADRVAEYSPPLPGILPELGFGFLPDVSSYVETVKSLSLDDCGEQRSRLELLD